PPVSEQQVMDLREQSQAFLGLSAQEIQTSDTAMALGRELAAAHCASCHGAEGREPRRGVPDLASAVFNYGDGADAIRTTITQGRHSIMPALGGRMGEVEIGSLVALVRGFSEGEAPATFARTAQTLYEEN